MRPIKVMRSRAQTLSRSALPTIIPEAKNQLPKPKGDCKWLCASDRREAFPFKARTADKVSNFLPKTWILRHETEK